LDYRKAELLDNPLGSDFAMAGAACRTGRPTLNPLVGFGRHPPKIHVFQNTSRRCGKGLYFVPLKEWQANE